MLHMHFDFLERSPGAHLLTDEHDDMIAAIAAKDVARADALAHAHTRQFRDNFMDFMKENYATEIDLGHAAA
jgi:DNA-binding GntR family transcriptional regulator